jgi:two-component system, NarL family, sensor histidine kinase UhpB
MTNPERARSESTTRVLCDLALVAAATVACGALAIHFEWTERLFAWTRRTESLQLDELSFVLLSLAIGLAWFAARRWRGTRRELTDRLAVEAQLARALDEQRRLARQFVEQQERERKRLSQELHDELAQFVNAIKIDAVSIRSALAPAAPAIPAGIPDRIRAIVANADLVHESVARLIRELRPVGLDELGLSAAIEHCANLWRERLVPTRLSVALDEHIDGLDEQRTLVLYRIVQEALTNCARHARASHVDVSVTWCEGDASAPPGARVRVEDDGIGVDCDSARSGLGLFGMRERVTALGGSLRVESAPRAGFRLLAHVPAAVGGEARA